MSVAYESDSDDSDSFSEQEELPDESKNLREELADIPLGEIEKLKDTVGLKKYNEAIFGLSTERENDDDDSSSHKLHKKQSNHSEIKMLKKKIDKQGY